MIRLNNGWEFTPRWTEEFASGMGRGEPVRLPHTVKELPLHYCDSEAYQGICGYRLRMPLEEEYQGQRLFLQFDGAAHRAEVYVNGQKAGSHDCGYTGFRVEITDLVRYDEENWVSVRLDTTENPEVPPFGYVIDYLTYGGLYRDVFLDIRGQEMISDLYVTTPDLGTARFEWTLDTAGTDMERACMDVRLFDAEGNLAASMMVPALDGCAEVKLQARPWSPADPYLYTAEADLLMPVEAEEDEEEEGEGEPFVFEPEGEAEEARTWDEVDDAAEPETEPDAGETEEIEEAEEAEETEEMEEPLGAEDAEAEEAEETGEPEEIQDEETPEFEEADYVQVQVGFRTIEFKEDGLYLNGERIFLRGLNRHQALPYVGYAVPEMLQREDARILQEELCCNAVRTSHYPQSPYFLDECDRRGLLVFTEIPGWQHLGDEAWQAQACRNVRDMVLQNRQHPSIVLWGVRINESQDCDALYEQTNRICHELDPMRPTSGVRYLKNSHLLEDVYAFNDFSHTGSNAGCLKKQQVMGKDRKPLLISEANGHMFPTKSFDTQERRQQQALRHARVLNDAMADRLHAGCFQWCMFDYNTHKDFGSGDRICYHGVLDMFRNPKMAAALYQSQGDRVPVLEVGASMNIGDYPAGQIGEVWVFTNAQEVHLYKGDRFVARFLPSDRFAQLPHPPVLINDWVGELLVSEAGLSEEEAAKVRAAFDLTRPEVPENLTPARKKKVEEALAGFPYERYAELYGRYVANWGGAGATWRFLAVTDGKTLAESVQGPAKALHLWAQASHTTLREGMVYDMAAVRLRVLDEFGRIASYAQLPVALRCEGDIELVGPSMVTLEGGMGGTYVRTRGRTGYGRLEIETILGKAQLEFIILREDEEEEDDEQ